MAEDTGVERPARMSSHNVVAQRVEPTPEGDPGAGRVGWVAVAGSTAGRSCRDRHDWPGGTVARMEADRYQRR